MLNSLMCPQAELTCASSELLSRCIHDIRKRLPIHGQEPELSDSETEYPITPPASEYSESRPLSPDIVQEHNAPITTILVSDPIPRRKGQKHLKPQRRRQNRELWLPYIYLFQYNQRPMF